MKNTLFAFVFALLSDGVGSSIFLADSRGVETIVANVALEEGYIEKTSFDFSQRILHPMLMMETDSTKEQNPLLNFFRDITGTWQASPLDSSFISQLEYKKSNKHFILNVGNTLTSKSGAVFAEYEGVYVYNPVAETITFTTVTKNEIHTGICEVKSDTLHHKAKIQGNSSIKSYSSAIVKMKDGSLNYYADYSKTDTYPELSFQNPLIYRKNSHD